MDRVASMHPSLTRLRRTQLKKTKKKKPLLLPKRKMSMMVKPMTCTTVAMPSS